MTQVPNIDLAQQLVDEVAKLIPEYLNDPIDRDMSGNGNAAVTVIAPDGRFVGRIFGTDAGKGQETGAERPGAAHIERAGGAAEVANVEVAQRFQPRSPDREVLKAHGRDPSTRGGGGQGGRRFLRRGMHRARFTFDAAGGRGSTRGP